MLFSIYNRFIFLCVVINKTRSMTSIVPGESHAHSCMTGDLSFDDTSVSTRMNDNQSYETIPSPSRIEHSPKSRHGILSSTLKCKYSLSLSRTTFVFFFSLLVLLFFIDLTLCFFSQNKIWSLDDALETSCALWKTTSAHENLQSTIYDYHDQHSISYA